MYKYIFMLMTINIKTYLCIYKVITSINAWLFHKLFQCNSNNPAVMGKIPREDNLLATCASYVVLAQHNSHMLSTSWRPWDFSHYSWIIRVTAGFYRLQLEFHFIRIAREVGTMFGGEQMACEKCSRGISLRSICPPRSQKSPRFGGYFSKVWRPWDQVSKSWL